MIAFYIVGYLILYVISYCLNKRIVLKSYPGVSWDWSDVKFDLFVSTFLLLGVILMFLCRPSNKNSKPPKWL